MDTACYQASATLTPGATGQDFTLDATVLEIVDIDSTSATVGYAMERVSVGELRNLRRNAGNVAASPTVYYALAGHNLLMFYPPPSATDTFTIYYVPVPTALAASADDPSTASLGGIPKEYHKAIEYFACSEAADVNDDESSTQGQKYFLLYQDQVKKIRRTLRRKGGSLMPRARVGPRSGQGNRRYVNHINSTY
jgi:hypothetical protein